MADEQTAVSSTATEQVIKSPGMETWTDEQNATWRMTGKTPEPVKASEKSQESSELPAADKTAAETKTVPDSETGKPQEPRPSESVAAKRIRQLSHERNERDKENRLLRMELEQLKSGAGKPAVSAEPDKPAELKEPNPDDFTGENAWEDYRKAAREYNRQETQRLIQEALESERKAVREEAQRAEIEEQNKRIESDWDQRTREFKASHPEIKDFEPAIQALVESGLIPPESFLDQWILQSEYGLELAWHFSQNLDEILRIGELHPIRASRELVRLELSFGNSQKANEKVPVNQKTAVLPKPPLNIGARNAPPSDEVEAAAASGDFAAYREKKNAREIAASRK